MKNRIFIFLSLLSLISLNLVAQTVDKAVLDQKNEDDRVKAEEQLVREKKIAEAKAREIDSLRESKADAIEYTLNPSSVELLVEMDPGNYGFRTRNHRMVVAADLDLMIRGRSMLRYEYRFFNHFSLSLMGGVDWSDLSLLSRFREQLPKPSPKQLVLLGGASAKLRLTEWYLHTSFFLEPSLLFGHIWQEFAELPSTHWRLKPGAFFGAETVFDSGLNLSLRLGAEIPIDFGKPNLVKERVEPSIVLGIGFAI